MSKKARPPIPLLDGKIIETHCHLDYLDDEQLKDNFGLGRGSKDADPDSVVCEDFNF